MEGSSQDDDTQRPGNINPEPGDTSPELGNTIPEPELSSSRPPSSDHPTDPTAGPQHDMGLNGPPQSSPVVNPKQGSSGAMELALIPLVPGPHSAQPISDGLGAPMPEVNSTESREDESVFVEDYMDENGSEDEDDEPMFVDSHSDGEDDEPMFVDDGVEVATQRAEDAQAEEIDPDELMEVMEEDIPQEARKRMQEEDAKRKNKEREEGSSERGNRGVKREREDNEEDESDSDDVQIIEENELSAEALRRIKEPRLSHLKIEGQEDQNKSQRQGVDPEATAMDDNEVIHVKTVAREQPILPNPPAPTTSGIKEENGNGQEAPVKTEDGTGSVNSRGKAKGDGTFAPIDGVEQALPANWDGSNNKTVMERYLRMSRKLRELVDKEKETGALEVEEHETLAKLRKNMKEAESKLNRTSPNGQENPGDDEDEGSDSDDEDNPEDPTYVDTPAGPGPTHRKPRGGGNGAKTAARRPKAAKSAAEWWARQYEKSEKKGRKEADVIPDLFHTGSRANDKGTKKGKRATEPTDAKGKQLLDILRDQDPVRARAALGDIPMPGAIGTNKKPELLRVIKEEAARTARPKTVIEEQKILRKASESFGAGRCKAEAGLWKLFCMGTPLYHHQLVGVHWMLGREFSPTGPHGGILADQMGLGKTVEMLAVIVHNPGKPTLIVVPAAAIPQWQEEIRKHVEAIPEWREETGRAVRKQIRVFHYKAKGPNNDIDNWKDADIVLASYQEVAKAYPSEEALRRISGMGLEGDQWRQELDRQLGQLYQVEFHRIVLDEAHAIKNINSRTSKACIHLPGKYRWALSGTPIHNCIEELLPYFKFLGADWALKDMEKFSQKYGGGANEGASLKDNLNARLAAVVPTLMIRRRVDDKFVGQDLLRIPKTNKPIIIKVDLSVEERIIYKRVEQRFRDNISSHMRNDNNDGQGQARQKKMRTYFTYLTRLRQLVGHPFQIETTMRVDFTLEDIKHVRRELAQLGGQTPLHMQIRRWMDTEEDRKRRAQEQETQFGASGFGGLFNMDKQLSRIESEKQVGDVICRICYELHDEETRITECGHAFCLECIQNLMEEAARRGRAAKCPACSAAITSHEFLGQDTSGAGLGDSGASRGGRRADGRPPAKKPRKSAKATKPPKPLGPGADASGIELRNANKTATFMRIAQMGDDDLPASAKTTAVKRKIIEWLRDYPNDKIIVFTHWVNLAQVLGHMLNAEKVSFLYYFGVMSIYARREAVAEFSKDDTSVRVLLASTKCGGQALNLTAANRVILVDLWWNSAVEQQAFGRVHRIGQTKETHFVKIVTRNTIDERLLDMQHEKDAIIGKTMRDGQSLSEREILRLVGASDSSDHGHGHTAAAAGGGGGGSGSGSGDNGKGKAQELDVCGDDIDRGEALADPDSDSDSEAEPDHHHHHHPRGSQQNLEPGKTAAATVSPGPSHSSSSSSSGGSDAGDEVPAAEERTAAALDDETMRSLLLAQLSDESMPPADDYGENEPEYEAQGAATAVVDATPPPPPLTTDETTVHAEADVDMEVQGEVDADLQDLQLQQSVAMEEEEDDDDGGDDADEEEDVDMNRGRDGQIVAYDDEDDEDGDYDNY